MILTLTTIAILTVVLVVAAIYLYLTANSFKIKNEVGPLIGDTAAWQVQEILSRVLENELLFNLVCDDNKIFHGYEPIDCYHINTSKFAKLCVKVSTVPMQLTTAERNFRKYKASILDNASRGIVNG